MVDKLDLRVPRDVPFSPTFGRLYSELRGMERGPFRAAKYYEYAADLREYGHNVRLNLYCQMDKAGNHKVELIDVGTMTRTDILRELLQLFDVDPLKLGIMRIDFAVDVPGIALQWFRDTVTVERKRFRAAVTGDAFHAEVGNGEIQTLYFGKRPNLIRIYDKRAEYDVQFRKSIRKLSKEGEPPTFKAVMGFPYPDSYLTRVERQIGGRVPAEMQTFRNVCSERFEYSPFAKLKIIEHDTYPSRDSNVSFETYCTGMHLHNYAKEHGMQGLRTFITRQSNGNAAWVWKKYCSFLGANPNGLNNVTLQDRFMESLRRQMTA